MIVIAEASVMVSQSGGIQGTGRGRDRNYWKTQVSAGLNSCASGIMTLRRSWCQLLFQPTEAVRSPIWEGDDAVDDQHRLRGSREMRFLV